MLTLEAVRGALSDRNLTKIAEATGLHYETVRRIARGQDKQVSYLAVKALSDYLERNE